MAITPQNRKPRRLMLIMLLATLALGGLLGAVATWGGGQWTPKLGLDLEGGQQVILQPQVREGQGVNQEELSQAVDIIRQRVDGQGVAEAQVTTLGDSVTVSIPGRFSQTQLQSLQRSSQMRFRPVLLFEPTQPAPEPAATGPLAPSRPPTAGTSPTATVAPSAPATSAASSTARAVAPPALLRPAAPSAPSAKATATPSGTATAKPAATPTAQPAATPTISAADLTDPKKLIAYATDEAWVTQAYQQELAALDCRKQPAYDAGKEDLTKPSVSCEVDGTAKYLLGPAVMVGSEIVDAFAGPETNQAGQSTGQFVVNLRVSGAATAKYAEVSRFMLPLTEPRNQLAVVLDNNVISAPRFNSAILDGSAQISGNFTAESAKLLADQLKFGALPISFTFQSGEDISPTLGGDQLRKGLVAGAIGLLLVVAYSLLQYRALGFVTVASLVLVALLTYLTVALFGWSYNLRLTMAGVTGAIVAIGTTADSFIVYFERVRDEVRDGRALRAAVETGWGRAKRTILISDAVNFLAAAVLYLLASSNVRGFAFMLMLTTILDVVVVFLFTHPLLSLLATTRFFGGGHKWSGFDPERLGAKKMRYVGRGRVVVGERTRGEPAPPRAGEAAPEGSRA